MIVFTFKDFEHLQKALILGVFQKKVLEYFMHLEISFEKHLDEIDGACSTLIFNNIQIQLESFFITFDGSSKIQIKSSTNEYLTKDNAEVAFDILETISNLYEYFLSLNEKDKESLSISTIISHASFRERGFIGVRNYCSEKLQR